MRNACHKPEEAYAKQGRGGDGTPQSIVVSLHNSRGVAVSTCRCVHIRARGVGARETKEATREGGLYIVQQGMCVCVCARASAPRQSIPIMLKLQGP